MLLLISITILHPTKVKASTNYCHSFLMLLLIPLHVKVKAIKLLIVICYSLFLFYCFDAAFHFTLVKVDATKLFIVILYSLFFVLVFLLFWCCSCFHPLWKWKQPSFLLSFYIHCFWFLFLFYCFDAALVSTLCESGNNQAASKTQRPLPLQLLDSTK